MVNMTNLIKQHDARVLKNQEHTEKRLCNCRVNVLCIKQMSLPTMNVKNTSEQLKKSLNYAKIITPCHLDTGNV